ncbi:MAG: hypothetical protein KGO82_19455, partial [Bacteroidota bacterium]|nr:hypothetical protein [Bacteroidota bacterium]
MAATAQATDLSPGQSQHSSLSAGEVHRYHIVLRAGQFASLTVEQLSIGIGYAVYGPNDSLISNEDLNALYQTEVINITAKKSGIYRVEIFWD